MKSGDCFAIERGKYTGKFIVFIKEEKSFYHFLMMPGDFKILVLKNKDFEKALHEPDLKTASEIKVPSFINFVETIPQEVYSTIELQFQKTKQNKKNIISDLFSNRNTKILKT